MDRVIVCLVATGCAATCAPMSAAPALKDSPEAAARRELGHLEGTWTLVSLEMNGRQSLGEDETRTFTFAQGKWALAKGGEDYSSGTVRMVEPVRDPRAFDLVATEAGREVVFTSIYRIDGDTLRYCTGPGRPKAFTAKAGDGCIYSVWKRKKP